MPHLIRMLYSHCRNGWRGGRPDGMGGVYVSIFAFFRIMNCLSLSIDARDTLSSSKPGGAREVRRVSLNAYAVCFLIWVGQDAYLLVLWLELIFMRSLKGLYLKMN
jgi:hypothetical protein